MVSSWGITDGSAGMQAQVRALAGVLGVEPEMKKIIIKEPFAALPNGIHALLKPFIIPRMIAGDSLAPPYPDLIISCGRRGAIAAMGLKTKAPHTKFICIQDPQTSSKHFDLVVAMEHDAIKGPNVIKTYFALHSITPKLLEEAQQRFAAQFASYPKPHITVLLGGSTNKYTLEIEAMARIVMQLQRMLKHTEGSLLITPSRRTGAQNASMLRGVGSQRVYIYDGVAENPYVGLLALADAIIVTNDSVNMMSEAAATGKPIYILPLPGHTDTKPARFANMLIAKGIARPLGDKIETWHYPVSDEMQRVAAEVKTVIPALCGDLEL